MDEKLARPGAVSAGYGTGIGPAEHLKHARLVAARTKQHLLILTKDVLCHSLLSAGWMCSIHPGTRRAITRFARRRPECSSPATRSWSTTRLSARRWARTRGTWSGRAARSRCRWPYARASSAPGTATGKRKERNPHEL